MRGVLRGSGLARGLTLAVALAMPAIAPAADELDRYLATIQRQIDDTSRPMAERQRLALEAAATLDRAAQDGRDVAAARAAWEQAARLLEGLVAASGKDDAGAGALRLQAAIYRWAQARTYFTRALLEPTDTAAREAAARGLEVAIAALRPLATPGADRIAVESRYRFAQALADRASLVAEPAERTAIRNEALAALQAPVETVPELVGHALQLKVELLLDENRPDLALSALESAREDEGGGPHPAWLGQKARALAALGRLDEARALVPEASAAGAEREELRLAVLLAGVTAARDDDDRAAIAHEALQLARGLEANRGRRARIAIARVLPTISQGLNAADREVLAEGLLLLGTPDRAAAELEIASTRAEDGDERGRLRYRAALAWREAGDLAASRRGLDAILADPEVRPWHARAALARAMGLPGTAPDPEGLRRVISRFPEDPAADEARYLLGWELVSQLEDEQALATWESIARGRPRHDEAVPARLHLLLENLESALAAEAGTARLIRDKLNSLLNEWGDSEGDSALPRIVQFARLRLELIDWMDRGSRAEQDVVRMLRMPLQRDERERLEIVHAGMLIRAGRHAEGERLARDRFGTFGVANLLSGGEMLERVASASRLDVERRRMGELCAEAAAIVLRRDDLGRRDRLRARWLASRAAGLRGDTRAAARELDRLDVIPARLSPRDRLALAETRRRAGLSDLAMGDYDALARAAAPGSPAWWEARLGAARCHLDAGRPDTARQVVEATAILAPDLGGNAYRPQFEALQRRLGAAKR